MERLKKLCCAALVFMMVIAVTAGCASKGSSSEGEDSNAKKKVESVAILLPGYITDKSWNQGAYEGLMSLESKGLEVAYSEDVQTADMESTFRNYCEEGYDFIIGHGVQYGDACIRVAEEYPDKYFFITGNPPENETEYPKNIAFYNYKEYEGAYVSGALAALQSKTGVIGYIGGGDNTTQAADKNAFVEGAKAMVPDINVKTVITGTFNDSSKGKETALAMIEQGVDVILQTCDETGLGAFEACEEKGIFGIGYTSDQAKVIGDDLVITSLMVNIPDMITSQIEIIESGEFGGVESPGLAEGIISLAPYSNKVTDEVKKKVDEIKQKIIKGEIVVTPNYSSM